MLTPQPRFKIYTNFAQYGMICKDLLLGRMHRGAGLDRLTQTMQTYFSTPYILPMPTARFAIYTAIKQLIQPGQKVILSPITIVDVINMVICAGGVPVFADVEPDSGNISADSVATLLNDSTINDVGAVLVTHLHGLACDIFPIKALCKHHQIPLIEDAAQAFSTKINEQYCGTIGDVGIFSFGMYKIINAFFGGMMICQNQALYETIQSTTKMLPYFSTRQYLSKLFFGTATDLATSPLIFQALTYHIFRHAYLHDVDAINSIVTVDKHPKRKDQLPSQYQSRLTPLQARLILKQLPHVNKHNLTRIKAAKQYHEGLYDIPELVLPPLRTDGTHIYTYYPIQYKNRRELLAYAMKQKRDWVLCHYHNCANLPIFKTFYRDCPNATKVANQLLYLPTYPTYRQKEIEKNIRVLRQYFGR